MRYASLFAKVLRDNGIELLSRVMGLLVAAIAVQLVARADRGLGHQRRSA